MHCLLQTKGHAVAQRATSRKVMSSIPDSVTGIFHWHNPFGRTVALELTQPLTEMSTRNISLGVEAAGSQGWQPYRPHVPTAVESWRFSRLEISGTLQGFSLSRNDIYKSNQQDVTI